MLLGALKRDSDVPEQNGAAEKRDLARRPAECGLGRNELLLSDLLGSDPDIVNRGIEQESEKQTLLRAVEKLDPREKQIMELRFG